jgi:very-short-patch-repair endonuclease
MKRDSSKAVLVAIVKSPRDLQIALEKHWYRVPVKSAPQILRDFTARYIAFYQNKSFGDESFTIRWYGEIVGIKIVKRKELFSKEKLHPRADEPYFRIELSTLKELTQPIISRKKRRIVFIPTTPSKFLTAHEINDLYTESKLEDKLWKALKVESIPAERQYFVSVGVERFALDFALFCKRLNLDVECDGDLYHTDKVRTKKDRTRNNLLASQGWQVLRFGQDWILKRTPETLYIIKKTINELGGIQVSESPVQYKLLPIRNQPESNDLFLKTLNRSGDYFFETKILSTNSNVRGKPKS